MLVDPVLRDIGADVEIGAEGRDARIAGRRHADERAGLRVALAELAELAGVFARQDAQVALDVARGEPRGMAGMAARADRQANFPCIVHRH